MHGPITRLGENPKTRCNSDSSYDNGILFNPLNAELNPIWHY